MKEKKQSVSVVMKFYRLERWFFENNFQLFSKIVYRMMQIIFGCTIPPSAKLGKGVDIPHFHGIVIHQDTAIGAGTLIYQNVTIGGRNGEAGAVIGENCLVAAGACVLGAITIGDNVNIGANAVVIHDVPPNCTVVGVPAKIVRQHE